MCALAIPLEICNGFKLFRKSDIFIVRGWDSGQPLTIIRGIFLRDVHAQMLHLDGIVVFIFFFWRLDGMLCDAHSAELVS